ncbi:hypothetical protein DSECCO2_495660 [anaerobic digester metagenome]
MNLQIENIYTVASVNGIRIVIVSAGIDKSTAAPLKTSIITDFSILNKLISRVHEQIEYINTIASVNGGQAVIINTRIMIYPATPQETFIVTDFLVLNEFIGGVNEKSKDKNTITSMNRCQCVIVHTGAGIGAAVPCVAFVIADTGNLWM